MALKLIARKVSSALRNCFLMQIINHFFQAQHQLVIPVDLLGVHSSVVLPAPPWSTLEVV